MGFLRKRVREGLDRVLGTLASGRWEGGGAGEVEGQSLGFWNDGGMMAQWR